MLAKTETQEAKQISTAKLKKLSKAKKDARTHAQEINKGVGAQIKAAVENDNLDKEAFAIASRLERMSPQKLWATLPALLFYIDELGIEEKAKAAPPLALEGEDKGEDE